MADAAHTQQLSYLIAAFGITIVSILTYLWTLRRSAQRLRIELAELASRPDLAGTCSADSAPRG